MSQSMVVLGTVLASLTVAESSHTPQASALGQGSEVRKAHFQAGRSLLGILKSRPGDLEVVSGTAPPFDSIPPKGMSTAEWKTRLVDWVALVRITGRKPMLTPEADWVTTQVAATVVEVLKNTPTKTLAERARISFAEQGGELSVGSQTLRAVVPWSRSLKPGAIYLLFGGVSDSGELMVAATDTYELQSGRLSSIRTDRLDQIDAIGSATTLETIRAKATLGKPVKLF